MASPYSDVYNMFLGDIKDDTFLDFTIDDRESILYGLLIKSITRFKACQKDLTDRDEVLGQFNQTLTEEEMLILATGIKKYWLNDKIYNLDVLRQRMTPKDWRMTSQAEHLKNLISLKQDLDTELSQMIVQYTVYACTVSDSQ